MPLSKTLQKLLVDMSLEDEGLIVFFRASDDTGEIVGVESFPLLEFFSFWA